MDDIQISLSGPDITEAEIEAVVEVLRPIQERFNDLSKNKDYLETVYKQAAEQASYVAGKTLKKVYKKVGFVV